MADNLNSRDLVKELRNLEENEENDDDDRRRLKILRKFFQDIGHDADSPEMRDGVYFIHDDNKVQHAMEYAEEASDNTVAQWPYTCIDWEKAAYELFHDYTSVEFDGDTYHFLEP